NTVVLTASKAVKYFPDGNPVGKVIYLNDNKEKPYTVKGVLEDIPENSHLYDFDFFLSLAGEPFYDGEQVNWMATNYVTYFKFRSGTNISQLGKKMAADLINNYYIPAAESAGRQVSEYVKSANIVFQPVADIHLYSHDIADYDVIMKSNGDIRFVWLFGGVAGFI